jgi:hypothetical protein
VRQRLGFAQRKLQAFDRVVAQLRKQAHAPISIDEYPAGASAHHQHGALLPMLRERCGKAAVRARVGHAQIGIRRQQPPALQRPGAGARRGGLDAHPAVLTTFAAANAIPARDPSARRVPRFARFAFGFRALGRPSRRVTSPPSRSRLSHETVTIP